MNKYDSSHKKTPRRRSWFDRHINVILICLSLILFILISQGFDLDLSPLLITCLVIISILMIVQSAVTLFLMIYAWNSPEKMQEYKSPKRFANPQYSFSLLIPARHEEGVIADTIKAINRINYPDELKEVLIICDITDSYTIETVQATISKLKLTNYKLVSYDTAPINKPHALNEGLKEATKDIVAVFDAEDEPHSDILNIANTVFLKQETDVLQSGVQLMNYQSHWFSTLNVLEYYFWFKSALHFFAHNGLIPLGGNTVFFRKSVLTKVGGWDNKSLTEDAEIGMRLSRAGAKIRVVYDEKHTTKEETPDSTTAFIRQRTRWNQGYLQLFLRQMWRDFPTIKGRVIAFYTLSWPFMQAFFIVYTILAIISAFFIKLPVILVILTLAPFYLLFIHQIICIVALYEFTKQYKLKYSFFLPLKIIFTFIPFYLVLGISAMRALYRMSLRNTNWEKTSHVNAHRSMFKFGLSVEQARA